MTLKILFAGDFAPCLGFESMAIKKRGDIFGDLRDEIAKADVSFLNLETPLCVSGNPIKKAGPNLSVHPNCIKAVAEAGFDIVGLANNHIMDYGEEGLRQTTESCKIEELATCGAGTNLEESQKPLLLEKDGLKVAIIAVAEHEFSIAQDNKPGVAPLDLIDNLAQLDKARGLADLVFMTIHGGNEYFPYPRPGLRKFCRFYIDRGVDAVICHHSHVVGAYEFYKGKPIVYSLGNLIFDSLAPPDGWNLGYAIRLEYDKDHKNLKTHELIPYTQSVAQGGIGKMNGSEKEAFMEMLEGYRKTIADEMLYAKVWGDFCVARERSTLLRMFFPWKFRGLGKIASMVPIERLLLPRSSIYRKINLIHCQSHLELLSSILEKKCE